MKNLLILVSFLFISLQNGICQDTLLIKNIENQNIFKVNDKLFLKSKSGIDKYYEIDKDVITIKSGGIGILFLDSVKNTRAYKDLYKIERISKSGFIDIRINSRKTDILKMIDYFKDQFPNSLIELNTYGEYLLTPNDPEAQWHIGKIGLNSTWDNVRGDNCVIIGMVLEL